MAFENECKIAANYNLNIKTKIGSNLFSIILNNCFFEPDFVCSLFSKEVKKPTETDSLQIASEWIDIDSLRSIRLLPKAMGDNIRKIINCDSPIFLGSEHIRFNHG